MRDAELARAKKKFSEEPDDLDVYPQPKRCRNCGNWVTMMCMIGTGYCSLGCEGKAARQADLEGAGHD